MNLSSQLENVSKLQPQNDAIIWHSGSISFAKFFNMASCIGSALVKKFKLKKINWFRNKDFKINQQNFNKRQT